MPCQPSKDLRQPQHQYTTKHHSQLNKKTIEAVSSRKSDMLQVSTFHICCFLCCFLFMRYRRCWPTCGNGAAASIRHIVPVHIFGHWMFLMDKPQRIAFISWLHEPDESLFASLRVSA